MSQPCGPTPIRLLDILSLRTSYATIDTGNEPIKQPVHHMTFRSIRCATHNGKYVVSCCVSQYKYTVPCFHRRARHCFHKHTLPAVSKYILACFTSVISLACASVLSMFFVCVLCNVWQVNYRVNCSHFSQAYCALFTSILYLIFQIYCLSIVWLFSCVSLCKLYILMNVIWSPVCDS